MLPCIGPMFSHGAQWWALLDVWTLRRAHLWLRWADMGLIFSNLQDLSPCCIVELNRIELTTQMFFSFVFPRFCQLPFETLLCPCSVCMCLRCLCWAHLLPLLGLDRALCCYVVMLSPSYIGCILGVEPKWDLASVPCQILSHARPNWIYVGAVLGLSWPRWDLYIFSATDQILHVEMCLLIAILTHHEENEET